MRRMQPPASAAERAPRRAVPRRLLVLALAALVLVASEPALALEMTASIPARNARAVPLPLAEITVTFDAPIVLPPAAAFRVAGTMSGRHTGAVEVAGATLRLRSIAKPFQPGEVVTVNLRSDIAAVGGGGMLAGGRAFVFTIASRPCTPSWSSVTWNTASIPYYIHGGDLDGDGTPDLAVPNEGTHDVSVFRNSAGNGTFPTHAEYGVGQRPSSVFGEDFDNDGDQDLATADINSGTVTVLRNDGHGGFAFVASYPAGQQTRQIHGGDFDGDNDVDLAATSRLTDEVFLFYNNGNATFTRVAYTDVQNDPFAIRCADLDSDGHLDLAVGCQQADSLTVLTNDGDGTFTTTGKFFLGNGPWDLHANDLDGDGDIDLVSVATFSSQFAVMKNDGTGHFPASTLVNLEQGAFPLAVYTADLDGDGDLDAMTSNYSGGSANLLRNNGSGMFSMWTTLFTSIAGSYTWAHDLDGDGDLDLSVVDEEADQLFVFFNGGSPVDAPFATTAGLRLHGFPNPVRRGGEARLVLGSGTAIPASATADVYDVGGRWVRRLERRAGANTEWSWNGRDATGRVVAAGRYLAVVRAGPQRLALPLQIVP